MGDIISNLAVWALPAFFAITMREAIRARVAWYMGDKRIKSDGLLTFNPKAFIDPFGTFLFPLMMIFQGSPAPFGYGRRAVILPSHYRNPKKGAIIVALSGILASIAMALVAIMIFPLVTYMPEVVSTWLGGNVRNFIIINCVLAVFHLFPLLPLDGGWLLMAILPNDLAKKYQRIEAYGIFILVLIFMILPMMEAYTKIPVDFTQTLLWQPVTALIETILSVFGYT